MSQNILRRGEIDILRKYPEKKIDLKKDLDRFEERDPNIENIMLNITVEVKYKIIWKNDTTFVYEIPSLLETEVGCPRLCAKLHSYNRASSISTLV